MLATLLDPDAFPAREIAACYAARWQAETAYLHLKKTVRGTGRTLRGRSPVLARQEAWALLLVHNMIAGMAARAAAAAGTSLGFPETAVRIGEVIARQLGQARSSVTFLRRRLS